MGLKNTTFHFVDRIVNVKSIGKPHTEITEYDKEKVKIYDIKEEKSNDMLCKVQQSPKYLIVFNYNTKTGYIIYKKNNQRDEFSFEVYKNKIYITRYIYNSQVFVYEYEKGKLLKSAISQIGDADFIEDVFPMQRIADPPLYTEENGIIMRRKDWFR